MLWKDVEKKYGIVISEAMKKSKYLECITVSIDPETGEVDIPEIDIENAYRDIKRWIVNGWD
jgi:hypothetical protein